MSESAPGGAGSGTFAEGKDSSQLQLTVDHFRKGNKSYQDEFTIWDLYVNQGMTTTRLGEMFGVNNGTITYWMDKHGIAESSGRRSENGVKEPRLADKESLVELYHGEELKASEIADRLECSESLVGYWLNRHDIETRRKTDYRGERSAAYEGGPKASIYRLLRNSYQDENWVTYSKQFRGGDVECEMCGSVEAGKQGMNIHHIVPVMAGGTNGEYNLMPLCKRCHLQVETFTRGLVDRCIRRIAVEEQNS